MTTRAPFISDAGYPVMTPGTNKALSQGDFARLCDISDSVLAIWQDALLVREGRGETADFDRPANFWSQHFLEHNFSKAISKDFETLQGLRFYCYNFSGRRLLENVAAAGVPILEALPDDIDQVVFQNYRASAKLLRNYAEATVGVPREQLIRPPAVMGEVGIQLDEVIVNLDTIHYQTSMNGLEKSGLLDRLRDKAEAGKKPRILEIGAGYGALAYHLLAAVPTARYVIVDLPESLAFSAQYLAIARPDLRQTVLDREVIAKGVDLDSSDVTFIPNHLLKSVEDRVNGLDCVVNIMSLSEMSAEQVSDYARFVAAALSPTGVLYEQNHVAHDKHVPVAPILANWFRHRRLIRHGRPGDPKPDLYLDPHADVSLWSANADFPL